VAKGNKQQTAVVSMVKPVIVQAIVEAAIIKHETRKQGVGHKCSYCGSLNTYVCSTRAHPYVITQRIRRCRCNDCQKPFKAV